MSKVEHTSQGSNLAYIAVAATVGGVVAAVTTLALVKLLDTAKSHKREAEKTRVAVSANTRYIISTSGRPQSIRRYNVLLQDILGEDVAYLPMSSTSADGKIHADAFASVLRSWRSIGGAISRDIKSKIAPYLDHIDEQSEATGSVNTVVRRGEKLWGFNTDAIGFRRGVARAFADENAPSSALIYGYGGVTRTVVHVLLELGIRRERIFLTGRRIGAAEQVALELGVSCYNPSRGAKRRQVHELFVCAAPVTNAPLERAGNLVDALDSLVPGAFCFDHELSGEYLREFCKEKGFRHLPGRGELF